MSGENIKDINVIELLMQISNDVSSIKTDMNNFKESQRVEKENIAKDIEDVRKDCKREIEAMEKNIQGRITSMQTVQNNLVIEVDTLKHADEKKDAKKWRTIMAFVGTAFGGLFVGKLPDIIQTLILLSEVKK